MAEAQACALPLLCYARPVKRVPAHIVSWAGAGKWAIPFSCAGQMSISAASAMSISSPVRERSGVSGEDEQG